MADNSAQGGADTIRDLDAATEALIKQQSQNALAMFLLLSEI